MRRARTCSKRCHCAKGSRCSCWCGGAFHGTKGAVNRQALAWAINEADQKLMLERHGFKQGETSYIEQTELPLEVADAKQA